MAMRLAVDYGFKQGNLHRIELGVYDFNPRAMRVYEKIGFKLEGILRDSLLWQGEYHNQHIMSILENEWTEIQKATRSEPPFANYGDVIA